MAPPAQAVELEILDEFRKTNLCVMWAQVSS
jgi:hypothetical protein